MLFYVDTGFYIVFAVDLIVTFDTVNHAILFYLDLSSMLALGVEGSVVRSTLIILTAKNKRLLGIY